MVFTSIGLSRPSAKNDGLLALTTGTGEGYVFDLNSQRPVNLFNSINAFVGVHFMPESSQFVTLDKSGIPEIWDTANVVGTGMESLDASLSVGASIKWQPLIFPIVVKISTDEGLTVEWTGEKSWVTPLGTFTGELKLSSAIEAKIKAAIDDHDVVIIFENPHTDLRKSYAIHNGEGIEAAIVGDSKVVVKDGIIHVIISSPNVTVRFSRVQPLSENM